jgi:uncharacterized protein with HEPN domain
MSKPPKEEDRLRHMLDAAMTAVEFIKGRKRPDLDTDTKLALALVRLLEVLGEAARHVSDETQRRSPHIPWKEIAGTRDRLVHGYFDVDLDIVWRIVTADLPPLIAELKKIVS